MEQLLSKFLPDEESSDSQKDAYEFMLQTMGFPNHHSKSAAVGGRRLLGAASWMGGSFFE